MKVIVNLIVFAALLAGVSSPLVVFAEPTSTCPENATCLENPLSKKDADIPYIIGTVIKGVMAIVGALVLLMVVWGAGGWMLAGGNTEKIQEGRKTIVWAMIGAFILFVSYMFLNTVLYYLESGQFRR